MEFQSAHIVKIFFSYLILYVTLWTSVEKIDLDKMQSFLKVLKRANTAGVKHRSRVIVLPILEQP